MQRSGLPSMRRNLQSADLVVEEPPHSEPVQRLVTSAADAAVVHVRRHSHTQSFFAPPEQRRGMSFQFFTEFQAAFHPLLFGRGKTRGKRERRGGEFLSSKKERLTWRGERPRDSGRRSARSPAPCTGRTASPNWAPDPAATLPPSCLARLRDLPTTG